MYVRNDRELQAKLEEAAKRAKSRDGKAEAIIWTNVLFSTGLAAVPFGLDIWPWVGSNVTCIIALGHLYGFTTDRAQAGALMKQIFGAASWTCAGGFILALRHILSAPHHRWFRPYTIALRI